MREPPENVEKLAAIIARHEPRRWRIWWRVYGVLLHLLRLLPIAEWRREQWSWHLDIWGMDHFGKRRKP